MLQHHFPPATKGGLLYTLDVFCVRYTFTGCLNKNVKREKLEKMSNIEHFKETALRCKNYSYECKRVHESVDWEKGGNVA